MVAYCCVNSVDAAQSGVSARPAYNSKGTIGMSCMSNRLAERTTDFLAWKAIKLWLETNGGRQSWIN